MQRSPRMAAILGNFCKQKTICIFVQIDNNTMIVDQISKVEATPAALSVEALTRAFLSSQDVKPSSRDQYGRTLAAYFAWIGRSGYSLRDITREHLIEYKDGLQAGGYSTLTIASYLTGVRRFYEWTEALKYYPNVAKGIRAPRRKRAYRKQPLQINQVADLLAYYQVKALRDYAIVSVLIRTGLRTIEVSRANIEDITYKGGQRVLLVWGKGRTERDEYVVITDKAWKPVADYLATRPDAKGSEPLFSSQSNNNSGGRMSTRAISGIAKEGLKAIGLTDKAYTAHSLRHTAIVNARRAGATPEQAQMMARHASPATTQIYDEYFRMEERLANSAEAMIDSLF